MLRISVTFETKQFKQIRMGTHKTQCMNTIDSHDQINARANNNTKREGING